MKRIILAVLVTLSAAWLTAQNPIINNCPEQVKDYDGNTYNVVRIGNLCWMKENLRTTCYSDGEKVDFERTGRSVTGYLYTWNVAKGKERGKYGICPDGWYLPSDWEWQQMEIDAHAVDRSSANKMGARGFCAVRLCDKKGWETASYYPYGAGNSNSSECNQTGFSAVPSGKIGAYESSRYANFWTSTEFNKNDALIRQLYYYSPYVYRKKEKKDNVYSVRCVQQPEHIDTLANSVKEKNTDSQIDAKRGEVKKKTPQKANTSDTLAIFDNGYVLHKLWTSPTKNVVSVVMSQPEGVYRGLLYVRNITNPSDIVNQKTIDCQHLAGAFEIDGKITDKVIFATEEEWSSIVKTWDDNKLHKVKDDEMFDSRFHFIRQYVPYYHTSFTFSADGKGFQTVSGKSTVYATLINTSYSNGLSGIDRRTGSSVRGGYSYTTEGTAKNNFTWEIRDGHLILVFGNSPTANVTVTMTDKFEKVHQSNRQQMIAQAKRDMSSNPELAEQKKNVTNALKILSGSDIRVYQIMVISQHTLRLIPAYFDNNNTLQYADDWIDLYSNDAENMFLPSVERLVVLADTNFLRPYESDSQREERLLKEKKIEEEKRIAEEKKKEEEIRIAEEKRRLQELQPSVSLTCTSIFEKLQKCISEKTGYYDFSTMNDNVFQHFDFSTVLSAEEATSANKATVLLCKLYPWLPLSNFQVDSIEVDSNGNVYALNTLNRNESPKNVFDTYLTLRLPFANNFAILIDSISYKTQQWQDNSEKKYDMREQMMVKDQLLLGNYKKIAPFVVKAYLNYQKKHQISVKKHYQQSDPEIHIFTMHQYLYLTIANLREHSIEQQQFISTYAGKTHTDVVKVLKSFIKQKESELLPEKGIQDLIELSGVISDTEEKCLDFLMNRRIIEENHKQISSKKKTCKYIVDAYEKHFKSLDQSWHLSEKNDKLARERELQRKVLALINRNNVSELNAKAKQIRKENIEVMIERLK